MRILPLISLSFFLTPLLHAAEAQLDDVIAQARGLLGTEEALTSVETLHYSGTVLDSEGAVIDTIELYFKKPYFQKLIIENDKVRRTTAVNISEGFIEVIDKEDEKNSGILILDAARVRRLIANAVENLYYYQGPKQRPGGKIELLGTKTVHGKQCYEVKFSYPSGLFYVRYFDVEDGSIVSTINGETNMENIETDVMVIDGIRFPKKIASYDEEGDLLRTVVFEEITVNEPLDNSIFEFPGLPASMRPQ